MGSTTVKALRYGLCVTWGSHSFICHPHTNHTCLYSPATRHHRPLPGTLRQPTKGWPGWADLGGWPHTEINIPHRELNLDMVTHLSTNWARRWLTSLIEANTLTTTPGHHHPYNVLQVIKNGIANISKYASVWHFQKRSADISLICQNYRPKYWQCAKHAVIKIFLRLTSHIIWLRLKHYDLLSLDIFWLPCIVYSYRR